LKERKIVNFILDKKNIGIVTTWFSCGAGNVSLQYFTELKKNFNVFIYARGGPKANTGMWANDYVTWAPEHPEVTGIYWWHFKSWVERFRIETVFFNEQRYWPILIKARDHGLRVGAYVDYYTQETVEFFKIYNFIICNTKRHYSVFKNHPNSYYIPWGLTENRWPRIVNKYSNHIRFLISGGWDGCYARTSPWMDRRGVSTTMRAFLHVKGDCKLLVYSQVPLKACPDEWKRLVSQDQRIEFIVGTFEPFPFHSASVYVYPSRLDGLGLTVTEAICAGLPVITTNIAPMNEFVTDGITGTLVSVEKHVSRPDGYYWPESFVSQDDLAFAMQTYVDNPNLVKTQSCQALKYADYALRWEDNGSLLLKIFSGFDRDKTSRCKSLDEGLLSYNKSKIPHEIRFFLRKIKRFFLNLLLGGRS
jgi:glycosyltransferase involved in cell wall biosynthesis